MVDICMCINSGACKKASTCFRAIANKDEYQTVAYFYDSNRECEHYWPIKDIDELNRLNKEWK